MAHTRTSFFLVVGEALSLRFQIRQIVKPLWPFMIAGTVTMYLVSKAQDAGVKCASLTGYWLTIF
jgi:hypothetical protein